MPIARRILLTSSAADRLDADFMVVPYVSTPGAEAYVRASFAVEDAVPG